MVKSNITCLRSEVIEEIEYSFRQCVGKVNDKETRVDLSCRLENILNNEVGLGNLYDYKIICDETNNTSDIIKRGELVSCMLIKKDCNSEYKLVMRIYTKMKYVESIING